MNISGFPSEWRYTVKDGEILFRRPFAIETRVFSKVGQPQTLKMHRYKRMLKQVKRGHKSD